MFPAGAHSAPAGPKIVLAPICLSTLGKYHAVYTRRIGRIHSLATTSGPAIIKMADLEQSLFHLSNSKIRQKT